MKLRLSRSATRDQRGFSAIEVLIAVGILLAVTGGIVSVMSPAHAVFQAEPERADMQQRLRVAADALSRDLVMAGAGTYLGSPAGPLANLFAPVLPLRLGYVNADGPGTFKTDTITILYVPPTSAQTTIGEAVSAQSGEAIVNADPGCPTGDPSCGFDRSMGALIYDDTGAYDLFTITGVQGARLTLRHDQIDTAKLYAPGARIAQVMSATYWLNAATHQLMHYDGSQSDAPVADNVVSLSFEYFGEPQPPGGALVRLDRGELTDGPWRLDADDPNRWDADLLRVRSVVVSIRVQSALAALRGRGALFRNPGTATSANRTLPDQEIRFEVAPRNLNLGR